MEENITINNSKNKNICEKREPRTCTYCNKEDMPECLNGKVSGMKGDCSCICNQNFEGTNCENGKNCDGFGILPDYCFLNTNSNDNVFSTYCGVNEDFDYLKLKKESDSYILLKAYVSNNIAEIREMSNISQTEKDSRIKKLEDRLEQELLKDISLNFTKVCCDSDKLCDYDKKNNPECEKFCSKAKDDKRYRMKSKYSCSKECGYSNSKEFLELSKGEIKSDEQIKFDD